MSERYDTTGKSSDGFIFISDEWDDFEITIKTTQQTYRIDAGYDYLRQPFYDRTEVYENLYPIQNFEINSFLIELLPFDFEGIEKLKIDKVINLYIKWYLYRNGIIDWFDWVYP